MSHAYYLLCEKCGDSTHGANHAEGKLCQAVETSYPLWLLKGSGWDVWNLDYDCISGVATFILQHFTCDAFVVVSEYWRGPDSEERYPRKRVRPIEPRYPHLVLEAKVAEARAMASKLKELAEELTVKQ